MAQPFHIAGAAAHPFFDPYGGAYGAVYGGAYGGGGNLLHAIFEKALGLNDLNRVNHAMAVWNLSRSIVPNIIDLFKGVRHYIRLFFTSAITIRGNDELYHEVLAWLAHQQSQRRFVKEYTAQTLSYPRPRPNLFRRDAFTPRSNVFDEASSIKYTPAFRTTWFFHRWNLFAVLRNDKHGAQGSKTSEFISVPDFDYYGPVPGVPNLETVTITCLGWSTAPIQALLKICREETRARKRKVVTIRSGKDDHWMISAVKPVRPLDTIHLEEHVKNNLINDIERYLDPQRRLFYNEHGIPYRRGYLLHGPPGCGKSSLSLALAGHFGLDLYMVNLSSIYANKLESLFAILPARCFVLLEDIDAVGLARDEEDDKEQKHNEFGRYPQHHAPHCSFSSLLNVLDGVASQEGRVVIMTSNFPDKLDEALVRPGRIDVRIFMGHITQSAAEQMFLRMMRTGQMDKISSASNSREHSGVESECAEGGEEADGESQTDEELQVLARQFAQHVPEETLTPAQLQGYLLKHLESAKTAVEEITGWIADEKLRAKKELERKGKKGKQSDHHKEQDAADMANAMPLQDDPAEEMDFDPFDPPVDFPVDYPAGFPADFPVDFTGNAADILMKVMGR